MHLRWALDSKGAKSLRDHLLDSEKRYLVYTTHILMDKSPIAALLVVHMPQSFGLELLRTNHAQLWCSFWNFCILKQCSGIPSLIFSEMSLHEESLPNRFNRICIYVHADEQREVLVDGFYRRSPNREGDRQLSFFWSAAAAAAGACPRKGKPRCTYLVGTGLFGYARPSFIWYPSPP